MIGLRVKKKKRYDQSWSLGLALRGERTYHVSRPPAICQLYTYSAGDES
jgi:hypothetical protein